MLKRLWLLCSTLWALPCLWGGIGRPDGILPKDIELAAAPFLVGWFLLLAARFVLTGKVTRLPNVIRSRRP